MSPLINKALDPFIQILKPISPLAWMPLALYTIKDSGLSAIFCDFHLLGVADAVEHGIRRCRRAQGMDQRSPRTPRSRHRQARIHCDFAGSGTDDSHGHADLDRHCLAGDRRRPKCWSGGTGIGYFVWNEWNNLSITNVIIAILLIGLVGMLLDQILARSRSWSRFRSEAMIISKILVSRAHCGAQVAAVQNRDPKQVGSRVCGAPLRVAPRAGHGYCDRQIHFHRRHRQALSGRRWRSDRGVRESLAIDGARRIGCVNRTLRLRQDHGG